MPQVDLETLVTSCAGGAVDRKVACETHADDPAKNDTIIDEPAESAEMPPDFPPDSFWLSKDAEHDWFDRNAFYERKDSTKANSNSNPSPNVNPNSQRFSAHFKKASIFGLPKTQKTTYVDSKRRTCKPPNIRLFPKRTESVGKSSGTTVAEPGSPKVSCMGRVRSKRGRRRSNSVKRDEIPAEKSVSGDDKQKSTGFCSKLMNMFWFFGKHRKSSRSGSRRVVEEPEPVEPQRKSVSAKPREIPSTNEPPALGGMQRFASGRRSGSWTSDDFNQAIPGDLDRRACRR